MAQQINVCETWTLLAATENKLQAFENKCMRKILRISYLEHRTNEYVWDRMRISSIAGPQETITATIKRRKLAWFGHGIRAWNKLPEQTRKTNNLTSFRALIKMQD